MTHQPNDWEDKQLDQWLQDTYGHRHVQWGQVLWATAAIICWLVGAIGILVLLYAGYRIGQVMFG